MSKLALHQQEFQDLLVDVQNLEVALRDVDCFEQANREIDLAHNRFKDLREQLSICYRYLPDGSLVVEPDNEAFWRLSRDREHSNIEMWKVSDTARIQQIRFSSITDIELAWLPKLSQLKGLHIIEVGDIDCSPIGDLPTLKRLIIGHSLDADLSFLGNLRDLRVLSLVDFDLSSVEPIASSTQLVSLSLEANPIEDLSTIDKFPNLRELNLNSCRRQVDLAPLIKLPFLENLIVRPLLDDMTFSLDVLLEMHRLKFVWVSPQITKSVDNKVILDKLEERKVEVRIS